MTPAEQIAYLRTTRTRLASDEREQAIIRAVCDLAERALLTDDEADAVRTMLTYGSRTPLLEAVLRRLLPDEDMTEEEADAAWEAGTPAVRAWCAHAGIGGTE